MEPMTAGQLARWAGGSLDGDPDAPVGAHVVLDSRQVTPGCVFVAFAGDRVDGHDFVAAAGAAGAAAALVERSVDAAVPQVVVPDAVAGLSELARHVVADAAASGLVVVGITASSGKTSTKDLVAQVLETAGPTVAPPGSFNNEIGHPLTATRVDRRTRFLVSELGARGVGHVAWLCSITPPRIGAVLNVGSAHLGEFGSVDAIARAKGELVEALPADGWAVLNADDPRVAAMASRTRARLAAFSVSGDPGGADLRVWASDAVADDLQRYSFTLHAAGAVTGSAPVALRVLGEHQVANACAAAAIALAAGLEVDAVARALSAASARSRWRMEATERADGVVVLNDAYNANPDSMAAALDALAGLRRPGGRLVAVLGDMLELGDDAADAHASVGRRARDLGVDELVAVGDFAADLAGGFAGGSGLVHTVGGPTGAAALLGGRLARGDVVLVKASRGLALERVAEELLALSEGAAP